MVSTLVESLRWTDHFYRTLDIFLIFFSFFYFFVIFFLSGKLAVDWPFLSHPWHPLGSVLSRPPPNPPTSSSPKKWKCLKVKLFSRKRGNLFEKKSNIKNIKGSKGICLELSKFDFIKKKLKRICCQVYW